MTTDTFTCAECRGVFAKTRSDEEAMAEYRKNFPGAETDERVTVCTDCFKKMVAVMGLPGDPNTP